MVRSIPTLLLFKGGAVADQSVGLISPKKLKDMLEKVL
jgi:thioredoxin-like negative regulator of GroEL